MLVKTGSNFYESLFTLTPISFSIIIRHLMHEDIIFTRYVYYLDNSVQRNIIITRTW